MNDVTKEIMSVFELLHTDSTQILANVACFDLIIMLIKVILFSLLFNYHIFFMHFPHQFMQFMSYFHRHILLP